MNVTDTAATAAKMPLGNAVLASVLRTTPPPAKPDAKDRIIENLRVDNRISARRIEDLKSEMEILYEEREALMIKNRKLREKRMPLEAEMLEEMAIADYGGSTWRMKA